MSLDDFPSRGTSGIYSGDGSSRVPKTIRDSEEWEKGQGLEWVSKPEEEYVRVYPNDDAEVEEGVEDNSEEDD